MNIFALDRSPIMAAHYHCDKHVVKMIVETAQLLSTAHHILDGEESPVKDKIYKKTHINHPCSKWVRENYMNYCWTYQLFRYLLKEYNKRYGKIHACTKMIDVLFNAPENIQMSPLTEFPQCMPDDCKQFDTIEAYRDYYVNYKADFAKWKTGEMPHWYQEKLLTKDHKMVYTSPITI